MSKHCWNPSAQRTFLQINSTLDMLSSKSLLISYNIVSPPDIKQHYCQITWNNHKSGRSNSGKAFTKLEQYMNILETNSYHGLLFDGSLIRVNFEFEDDKLLRQNLLWWPSPYDYGDILLEGFSPVDILRDFYGDEKWHEYIRMRSPVRVDFDSDNYTETHPQSHLHIEHEDTRLNINNPICFNKFIDFIFRNFYPQIPTIRFQKSDFIDYKITDFSRIECIPSQIII